MNTKLTRHVALDDALRDQAALFALDALPLNETQDFETHLSVCDTCRVEVESLRSTVAAIGSAVPGEVPDMSLRGRLLDRARGGTVSVPAQPVQSSDVTAATQYLARASEGVWQSSGFPGVDARILFLNPDDGRATLLVRMAPGATYPSHRHRGVEECLVLEGDLMSGDTPMGVGDYRRATAGSVDGVQSTRDGCLLLFVSSLGDEIFPAAVS